MSALLMALLLQAPPLSVIVSPEMSASDAEIRAAFSKDTVIVRIVADDQKKEQEWLARGRKNCSEGEKKAFELEAPAAIAAFESGLELLARAQTAITDYNEVARCLFAYAVILSESGKVGEGKDAFRRALILDPTLTADPKRHPPKVVGAFSKLKQAVERSKRGSLTLTGAPSGADVWLDGRKIGRLPVSAPDLVAGEHWLSVRAPGHKAFSARSTVKEREVNRIEIFLQERDARPLHESVATFLGDTRAPTLSDTAELKRFSDERAVSATALVSPTHVRVFDHATQRVSDRARATTLSEAADLVARFLAPPPAPPKEIAVPASTEVPPPGVTKQARPAVHPAVAILPLGIGQFAERRPVPGALLLASQLLLLGGNLACYWIADSFRMPGDTYRNATAVEALKWSINISFGVLIADVIAGAIDGLVHRQK